jgi:KDO2-lipid IV(A) lauroyltransferase
MRLEPGRLLGLAWAVAPRLPEPLVRGAMALAADITWLRHGDGVRQLEANLARVRPGLGRKGLRRLSRTGMRSYLRYYAEILTLPGCSAEQVDARVRVTNDDWIRRHQAGGGSVVVALGHQGNWDLAGAWAGRHLAPVTTVAERLEPESVFEEFRALREGFGLRIVPLAKGGGGTVFRRLVETVRAGSALVPLLADRDLTSHGIEVELFGEPARVAAGPAALTAGDGAALCVARIGYERLGGERRRAAGTPWGIHIVFGDPVDVDPAVTGRARVQALTQAWVDEMAQAISADPAQWHMLQRVFVADLDPARLTRVAAGDGRS